MIRVFAPLRWSLLVVAVILLQGSLSGAFAGTVVLSSFEQDLSSSVGVEWTVGAQSTEFTSTGATEGSDALQINHNPGWTNNLTLNTELVAPLIAEADYMLIDVTTPPTTVWRQMFVAMQGEGLGYTTRGGGVMNNATSTWMVDLNASPFKAAAANNPSWWQIILIHQGGDGGANPISTTIDNIRFFSVPEPISSMLALLGIGAVCLTRRRAG